MGGQTLMRMIQRHLEEKQQFEECAKIDEMLAQHGPYTESFHERKRAEQGAAHTLDSPEEVE